MTDKSGHSSSRRKLIISGSIFLVFLLLVLVYSGSQHVFTVKNIEVSGQYELSDREIERISGIKRGANMFDLDLLQGIKNLIREPFINKVYIYREFPDKVKINVIERHPIVLIELAKDYAIDAFGIMLPPPINYPTESLPIIRGVDPSLPFELGKLIRQQDIINAIAFLNHVILLDNEMLEYCSIIRWSEEIGWIIQKDKRHPEVHLGKTNLVRRIDMFEAFLDKMENDNVDITVFKYINLRFEKQIIVSEK